MVRLSGIQTSLIIRRSSTASCSRSAAVALFVEAWSGAPLEAREFACEANEWVIDRLLDLHPDLEIETPPKTAIHDRRAKPRLS